MSRTSAGRSIANLVSLKQDEKITSIIPVRRFEEQQHLLMATKKGIVKKTGLMEYSRPRAGGIIGVALDEGDDLIGVVLTRPGDEVVLSTRQGLAIRFAESDARAMGRNARGVKGINLGGDDAVVGITVTDPAGYLLTICEKGYGKRTPFGANMAEEPAEGEGEEETPPPAEGEAGEEVVERGNMRYRKQRRGGKGLRDIRATDRNGPVIGVLAVQDNDDIMLITTQGMVQRTHVSEVRPMGRNTQGVRIMNLNEGDQVASIAKVAREEEAVAPPMAETPPAPESPPTEDGNASDS
jgi:DNA gyrase subunit A